ncbi:hypothetical protein ACFS07_31805 [Undibacterium arcticum]
MTLNTFLLVAVDMKLTEFVISLAATTQSPAGEMPTPSGDSPKGTVPTTALFPQIHNQQCIGRLIANVQGVSVMTDGQAARFGTGLNVSNHTIAGAVNDGYGPGFFSFGTYANGLAIDGQGISRADDSTAPSRGKRRLTAANKPSPCGVRPGNPWGDKVRHSF